MIRILLKRLLKVTLITVSLGCLMAKADPITLKSSTQQIALLELYTSEGCSSCPPADRWLSKLKNNPKLWQQIVPVAFHVDYWDYIGWPDRFAIPEYSQRQRAHALNWGNGRVYTPGLVHNGNEWYGWFNDRTLPTTQSNNIGSLELNIADQQLQAAFSPLKRIDSALDLHIAVLGFDLVTQVKAGENHGRELRHDFVVLGYQRVPLTSTDAGYKTEISLPTPKQTAPRQAIAAWVSSEHDPRPIQAVGGWL